MGSFEVVGSLGDSFVGVAFVVVGVVALRFLLLDVVLVGFMFSWLL